MKLDVVVERECPFGAVAVRAPFLRQHWLVLEGAVPFESNEHLVGAEEDTAGKAVIGGLRIKVGYAAREDGGERTPVDRRPSR